MKKGVEMAMLLRKDIVAFQVTRHDCILFCTFRKDSHHLLFSLL